MKYQYDEKAVEDMVWALIGEIEECDDIAEHVPRLKKMIINVYKQGFDDGESRPHPQRSEGE